MALIFPGKTTCALCQRIIETEDEVIGFPAFLPSEHRFYRYSDAAFHRQCFQEWPDGPEFEHLYQRFRRIWESRPKNLASLEEIDAWGKKAFKDWANDED